MQGDKFAKLDIIYNWDASYLLKAEKIKKE